MGANLILPAGSAAASTTADPVTRSLRYPSGSYQSFTPSSGSSDFKKWVFSCWVKRCTTGVTFPLLQTASGTSAPYNITTVHFDANDILEVGKYNSSYQFRRTTTRVFRDPSAWMCVTVVYDSTESNEVDRIKIYINGEHDTNQTSATGVPLNEASTFGTIGQVMRLNSFVHSASNDQGKSYQADVYFIDGNVTLPTGYSDWGSVFVEDTGYGSVKPRDTSSILSSSDFGTNGFHLKFEDNTNIGDDSTSNGNDFTATNLASSDVVLDRPSNNYATINPLIPYGSGTSSHTVTLSEGNLRVDYGSGSGRGSQDATIAVSSGKFYFEALVLSSSQSTGCQVGVHPVDGWVYAGDSTKFLGFTNTSVAYESEGDLFTNLTNTSTGFDTYTTGDVIGCAFDVDSRKVWFSKNGTWQNSGNPSSNSNPAVTLSGSGSLVAAVRAYGHNLVVNFGQDPTFAGNKTSGQDTSQNEFYYAPPTGGFKSLNTSNLDDPTIKPHEVFGVATYSGTGSATTVSTEFQPNLVWVKRRNSSANHVLTDSVRGANKALNSNTTSTEDSSTSLITAFNSTSFGVGTDSKVNASGGTYVGWNWKESASAGFDIVTWTGNSANTYGSSSKQTVSHSLGVSPDMIIAKARSQESGNYAGSNLNWVVWHKDLSSDRILNLNNTYSQSQHEGNLISGIGTSSIDFGNDLSWSYETLNIDYSGYGMNADTYVAYLFSGVEGFSKFGITYGNGSSDGPFVYCGFRPAFVMHKEITTSSYDWVIHDAARDPANDSTWNHLIANQADSENGSNTGPAAAWADMVSNGFKLRTSSTEHGNGSGKTYIYAAFAESPLKYANAR